MEVVKNAITFPSVTGLADINAKSWTPKDSKSVKGVIQIAHGMAEHMERYNDFATFLANNGYAVFANDHIGHGKSIKNIDQLGYFGENNYAGNAFVDDCKQLQDIAVKEYPDIPYIFFGHSMGSFIARKFSAKYGDTLSAAIYFGTSAGNPAAPAAIKLAEKIASSKGNFYRSQKLNDISFMGYNKKCENRTPFDWITRRQEVVDKYIADEKCGFLFTVLGFRDLFSLLDDVSKKSWYNKVPITFPILVMSGGMDPVGEYGKGIKKIVNNLRRTGHRVTEKIYYYARHELLNETINDEVYEDVLNWINKTIEEQ